jgi:hypothetical protein
MRYTLKLHPDSLCVAATQIAVDVVRPRTGSLLLTYAVTGNIGDLCLPPVASASRTDELWRSTCFEAFVRPAAGEAYYEFNFAPSTQWAAYRFGGYRNGMQVAAEIGTPRMEVQSAPERFTVQALLDLPGNATWRIGLSAVIEETNGRKSYWALAHPPGRADFHHADCFAVEF